MSTSVILWTFLAVICVGRGHQTIEHAKAAMCLSEDSNNKLSLVASGNKEFAFRLYRKLANQASSKGKNVFFSPLSISTALAAVSVGARGKTYQQLFSGLGFSSSQLVQTAVNLAFRTFISSVPSRDISQGTAVFVDNLFKPKPDFLNVLKQFYFSEGFNVDFAKSVKTANTINKYVSGKTKGKITKLVEGLTPNTVLYLLSYIYFKGTWATQFDPKLTRPDVFKVDENTEVPVQMMRMEAFVDIHYDEAIATSVLHLPFINSYSMLLLLPDHMNSLENNISPSHITRWLLQLESRKCKISVPKFSIKASYNLNDALIEMGIGDMFGSHADLSGIADGQKLVVSEVVHQATLDVDETGATAAAATGIGFTVTSALLSPELKFNRPFMVVITERSAQNILFLGKIVNPNILN